MSEHADKSRADGRQTSSAGARDGRSTTDTSNFLEDDRQEAIAQRRLQGLANDGASSMQATQLKVLEGYADAQTQEALAETTPTIQHQTAQPIQLEDDDDETTPLLSGEASSDEQDEAIKSFGLSLVGAYRVLDQAAESLTKGKNREAMKSAALSLGNAAILVGTALIGIPGVVSVGAEGAVVSATAESAGVTAGSSGAGAALGLAETEDPEEHARATAAAESAGAAMKAIVQAKVGSLKKAGNTLLGFVPGSAILKSAARSAKLAKMSQDDWNAERGKLIRLVEGVMQEMDRVVADLDLEEFGDKVIKAKGSRLMFTTKTKTLTEICTKYQVRATKLKDLISQWDEKHGESRPLLSAGSSEEEV